MMELKKKLTTLVVNVEGLESTVDRMKQEKKNRYNHIENSVQAEIETLKLFKDRVELELQIAKTQNRNVNESLALTEQKYPHSQTRNLEQAEPSDNFLKELQDMKKRM